MEPPTNLPRRATTLTRLWRSTDAADSIAQFLPTEALPLLPNIAKTFERDHWRLLGALMRRASRGTAAACKSAVLSTLKMTGRDTVHFREDWADQARFDEKWMVYRRRRDGGELESVEYTARVSQGALVLDRSTPHTSTALASRFDIPGVSDRCCIHRFRVALTYTANNEGIIGKNGSGFQFVDGGEGTNRNGSLFILYIVYTNGCFQLQWRTGGNIQTLKRVSTQHTFLVEATLDWRTTTARVTVDGAEFERPLPFRRLPVTAMGFKCGEWPGRSTLGPVDVWYLHSSSVRFETDP